MYRRNALRHPACCCRGGPATARPRACRSRRRTAAPRRPPSPHPPPARGRTASPPAAHTPSLNASSIPPPPKSPTRFSGGSGLSPRPPDRVQHAGQCDVVDVVPGRFCQPRPILPPAGHAPINQPLVASETDLRSDAQPLRHAWAERLHQSIGPVGQPQHHLRGAWFPQIDSASERRLRVMHGVAWIAESLRPVRTHPIHPDHVSAEVAQHHRRHRPRPDAGQLDQPDPGQRTHHLSPCCRRVCLEPVQQTVNAAYRRIPVIQIIQRPRQPHRITRIVSFVKLLAPGKRRHCRVERQPEQLDSRSAHPALAAWK